MGEARPSEPYGNVCRFDTHSRRCNQFTAHCLETALRDCRTLGDRHREAALRNNLADLLHAVGRKDEAMDELKDAVRLFADVGGADEPQPEIWKLVEW